MLVFLNQLINILRYNVRALNIGDCVESTTTSDITESKQSQDSKERQCMCAKRRGEKLCFKPR
ncbi:hypothetical protein [uncultured Helicobacter sp.]|uniref:hypothetical protein n=1 Tax=uncultured Helicobacter sp. TaxID=175537 RepID=UPI00374F6D43